MNGRNIFSTVGQAYAGEKNRAIQQSAEKLRIHKKSIPLKQKLTELQLQWK